MATTAPTDRGGLFRAIAAVVAAALVVASCTTTRPIDPGAPARIVEEVQPGDRVKITTRDGRELEFEVVTVEPDALVGAEQRVARGEIANLEVTQTSVAKTSALVGGIYLAFFLVMVLLGVGEAVALGPG
jgi:hypothetical protein